MKGNTPAHQPIPGLSTVPEFMPVLSRGKHRTPKSGGCFMEFASYLAGEGWSDHPACTHPVLASLARMVNDASSDQARSRLTVLIPSVIGVNTEPGAPADSRVGMLVAVHAATAALPVASAENQRALAVGLINCERHFSEIESTIPADLAAEIRLAFDRAPGTENWARSFIASVGPWSRRSFTDRTAIAVTRVAVQGIADACTPDADDRLHDLLAGAIRDCAAMLAPAAGSSPEQESSPKQESSPRVAPNAESRRSHGDSRGRQQHSAN
jgi:hypothetical protein